MAPDELDARLRGVENLLASQTQLLTDNLAQIKEILSRHDLAIAGIPGDERHLGFDKRIDRLEGTERIRRWALRSAVTALIGLIAERCYCYFRG